MCYLDLNHAIKTDEPKPGESDSPGFLTKKHARRLDRQIAATRANIESERDRIIEEEEEAIRVLEIQEAVLQAAIDSKSDALAR